MWQMTFLVYKKIPQGQSLADKMSVENKFFSLEFLSEALYQQILFIDNSLQHFILLPDNTCAHCKRPSNLLAHLCFSSPKFSNESSTWFLELKGDLGLQSDLN